MKTLNILLTCIVIILGFILVIVILDYNETRTANELLLYEKQQIEKVIDTFKEKYSDYGVTEYPDSNGIPWKYTAKANSADVELILGDDRVILRSYDAPDGNMICMVVNPFPSDVLDWCPPKW